MGKTALQPSGMDSLLDPLAYRMTFHKSASSSQRLDSSHQGMLSKRVMRLPDGTFQGWHVGERDNQGIDVTEQLNFDSPNCFTILTEDINSRPLNLEGCQMRSLLKKRWMLLNRKRLFCPPLGHDFGVNIVISVWAMTPQCLGPVRWHELQVWGTPSSQQIWKYSAFAPGLQKGRGNGVWACGKLFCNKMANPQKTT